MGNEQQLQNVRQQKYLKMQEQFSKLDTAHRPDSFPASSTFPWHTSLLKAFLLCSSAQLGSDQVLANYNTLNKVFFVQGSSHLDTNQIRAREKHIVDGGRVHWLHKSWSCFCVQGATRFSLFCCQGPLPMTSLGLQSAKHRHSGYARAQMNTLLFRTSRIISDSMCVCEYAWCTGVSTYAMAHMCKSQNNFCGVGSLYLLHELWGSNLGCYGRFTWQVPLLSSTPAYPSN